VEPTIKVDGIAAFDVDLNVFDSVDEAGDGGDDAAEVQDQKAGTVRLGQHVKLTRYQVQRYQPVPLSARR